MDKIDSEDARSRLDRIYSKITIVDKSKLETKIDDSIFDLVDDFLKIYEPADYPNLIVDLSDSTDSLKIGCLFDILIWSTSDNGERLLANTRKWMEQEDIRRIDVVLHMSDVYPMDDLEQLLVRLDEISLKHPELFEICQLVRGSAHNFIQRHAKPPGLQERLRKSFCNFLRSLGLLKK